MPLIAQLMFRTEEWIVLWLIIPAAIAGVVFGIKGSAGHGKLGGAVLAVTLVVTALAVFEPPRGLIAETTLLVYVLTFFFGVIYTFRPSLRLLGLGLAGGSAAGVALALAVM